MKENLHHGVARGESPRLPHQASRERRAKFLATPCAGGCDRLPPVSAAKLKNAKVWKCARCAKGRPRVRPAGPCAGYEAPCDAMPAKNSLQPADGPWRCRPCATRKAQAELSGDAKARARNGFRQWWAALSEEAREAERAKRCQLRECKAPGCQGRPADARRSYCSEACRQTGRPGRALTPCAACGGPSLKGRRTCSESCLAEIAARRRAHLGSQVNDYGQPILRSEAQRARRREQAKTKYRRPDKAAVIARLTTEQDGKCKVCGCDGGERGLVLDHCHTSGDPRAMLCCRCNAAFGLMLEQPKRIEGLLNYALAWSA